MDLKINSVIEVGSSNSLQQPQKVKTFLQASLDEANEFKIKNLFQKSLLIKTDDVFTEIDVFSSFGIVKEDVTFIHFQTWNSDSSEYNTNGAKFGLNFEGIDLGETSVFTLANIELLEGDIFINSFSIPAINSVNQEAVLLIIVGTK